MKSINSVRLVLCLGGLLMGFSAAVARPTHGYGDLIDEFCISRGRLRIAAHQPHCAMCHQPGTFDDTPANRVEPNWTEFERARATGDFSYFCPGGAATVPTPSNTPTTTASPAPSNPGTTPPPAAAPKAADVGRQTGTGMHGHDIDGGEMGEMAEMGRRGRRQPAASPSAPAALGGTGHSQMSAPKPGAMSTAPSASNPSQSSSGVAPIDRAPVPKPEVEQRLTGLRDEIGIKDSQRARWDVFAEVVRSAAQRHEEVGATPASAAAESGGDGVARLQLEQRHMSARIAALRYVSAAFTEFLAVLDDSQRKIANERIATIINLL